MATSAKTVDWQRGQQALRHEVGRVTTLLRSIHDPSAPAVGHWNLGDVAMHLSQVWLIVPGLARHDLSGIYQVLPSLDGIAGDSLVREIGELAEVMMLGVRSDPERDLGVLADRIETRAQKYLSECAGACPDELRPWLVHGVTVRLAMLTYHLLNETIVHGGDIARAARRVWRIEPAHAAMVLGRFVVPAIQGLDARALVHKDQAAGVRASYEVRIRGGDRFCVVFDEGAVTIEQPSSSRRVDCHISADPVAFLRVVWGRQSQWKAIAKGQLTAWGRKPWLGPRLRTMMSNP